MSNVTDIERLLAPISADKPCGESARLEAPFEQLEAEIAKLTAITPQPVAWSEVVRLSETILLQHSKDLLAAAYLCAGLYQTKSYAGMLAGLHVVTGLMQHYWEDLHPALRRIRGRIAAMEWLAEKIESGLEKGKPNPSDVPLLGELKTQLEVFTALLGEKLEDKAPGLLAPMRHLDKYINELAQQQKQMEEKKAVVEASAKAASTFVEVNNAQDIPKAIRQCQGTLKNVIKFLSAQDLKDPQYYRLNRLLTWLPVTALPPHQEGKTQVAAPSAERVKKYEESLTAGDFEVLLPQLEGTIGMAPFWLDGHRLACAALDALGEPYQRARQVVIAELAALLMQYPDLLELRFADDSPFASAATRLWVQQEVLAGQGEVEQESTDSSAPWMDSEKRAQVLASKGKFKLGLDLFREGLGGSQSERERYYWRLAQARFCFDNNHLEVAIPLLEELDQSEQQLTLGEWEPQLTADVLRTLLEGYVKLLETKKKNDAGLQKKAESIYNRLCSMDIEAAIKIGGRLAQVTSPVNPLNPFSNNVQRANF